MRFYRDQSSFLLLVNMRLFVKGYRKSKEINTASTAMNRGIKSGVPEALKDQITSK